MSSDFFEALLALEDLSEPESWPEKMPEMGPDSPSSKDEIHLDLDQCARSSSLEEGASAGQDPAPLIRDQAARVNFALDWASERVISRIAFKPSVSCQGVGGFADDEMRPG